MWYFVSYVSYTLSIIKMPNIPQECYIPFLFLQNMSTSFLWCILHSRVCLEIHSIKFKHWFLGGDPTNTYSIKSQSHPSNQVPRFVMSQLNMQLPHVSCLQASKSYHNIMYLAETRQCVRKEIEIWKPCLVVFEEDIGMRTLERSLFMS